MKTNTVFWAVIWATALFVAPLEAREKGEQPPLVIAVEFTDHAACAHIAREMGWFEAAGLNVISFDNYLTGMALAAALARGDVNAAYICLIPAINAYANAKVPLKVVAGTHRYGYGLLVHPEKVKTVKDLQRPDIRIGCPREGSPLDALLHKTVDQYHLDERHILHKLRRMPPAKVYLAIMMGQLDAGFCSEQFPTMGEASGLKVLLTAQDLWPDMQGSVLTVTEDLIRLHPETVRRLIRVTQQGIRYIAEHPEDASAIAARALTLTGQQVLPLRIGDGVTNLDVTPQIIFRSLTTAMDITSDIDPVQVQESIDYMAGLGYIQWFDANEILELRFLNHESIE